MSLKDVEGKIVGERGLDSTAYEHDWFNASQCSIMIGDVLIDTVVNINAQVNQNKVPVYSYANPYYSFLGDGQVAVTGSLTLAFKESAYLIYALKRFSDFKSNGIWQSPRYRTSDNGFVLQRPEEEITEDTTFTTVAELARRKQTIRSNVEQMMEWQGTAGNESFNAKERNAAQVQNNKFVKQLGALSDNEFEDWAETFEDVLWYGTDIQNTFMADKVNSFNLKEKDIIGEEDILSHRRVDQYPPVDIWIIYGDTNNHATNHTVQKILKVSFLGMSKTIEVNNQPIYETYPFIAQNLV